MKGCEGYVKIGVVMPMGSEVCSFWGIFLGDQKYPGVRYLVPFLLLLGSCRAARHAVDQLFVDDFNGRLEILEGMQGEGKDTGGIFVDDYYVTIGYFMHLTGIPLRADYSSTVGYRNDIYYHEDLQKLMEWFRKHRRGFTREKEDSILQLSSGWIDMSIKNKLLIKQRCCSRIILISNSLDLIRTVRFDEGK
jgi:hypothetical protein